ncbi:hypothetical protein JCM3775_002458 [Rhodotorula graminis]|uniref:HIT-type domain-containing protein n=1 Tax=Rhodotorula graminis (strain WP1) TaxID=578459 RepID=A0A0P9EMK2_RHOGW|nr:uncharacterized protein RHOBADRAFT_46106 [Rhodotorula graminis WP1]KPV73012.1 hypothetical protein RHOBADRAFT_46106 [Rhodotorula graminis WP1]
MLGTGKKDRRQPARAAQPAAVLADSEYVARRIKRHLADLERTNYTEPTTGPTAYGDADDDHKGPSQLAKDSSGDQKKKKTMAVRTLLMYRKNLAALVAESDLPSPHESKQPSYLTAAAPPPARPPLRLCSVCGYKPRYACLRCGLPYCDVGCRQTHDESRCERR